MKSEKIITEKPRIVQLTDYKKTNIIVGGQITLSIEDARALYNLTTLNDISDEDEFRDKLMSCRDILRNMSKAILFTVGEETPIKELISSFSSNKMKLPLSTEKHITSTKEAFSDEDLDNRTA